MSNHAAHPWQRFAQWAKRPAGRITGATIAAGLLSGYWTVSTMAAQGPVARPIEVASAVPADAAAAGYDLFGTVAPEDAGYRWAEMARISRIDQCADAGDAFRAGCVRYLGSDARKRITAASVRPVAYVDVAPVVGMPVSDEGAVIAPGDDPVAADAAEPTVPDDFEDE